VALFVVLVQLTPPSVDFQTPVLPTAAPLA
jgi:hypothetical protein